MKLLADLSPACCRWPVRERDGAHWFCAARIARPGLRYCAAHMQVAFPRAVVRQSQAERLALIKVAVAKRRIAAVDSVDAGPNALGKIVDAGERALDRQASTADSGTDPAPRSVLPDPPALGHEGNEPAAALRSVEPICLSGAEPAEIPTTAPVFLDVDPRTLLVEDSYQREMGPKSVALIRRIALHWDWRRFRPPVVAMSPEGGRVLDGQHTAVAAASRGLETIPVQLVDAEEVKARAEAFVGLNTDRLSLTPMQLHHAAVAAGDDLAMTIEQVCNRAGVTLVRSAYGGRTWKVGETQAINAVRALVDKRGAQKSRLILAALVAAELAPIAAHDVKAAEMLFTVADYAEQLEPITDGGVADLAIAIKALGDTADKEARVFAAAQCVPYWRALGVTWFKKCRKRRKAA